MGGETFKDIGYRGPMEAKTYKINPRKEKYNEFMRIRYIKGLLKGETRRLNAEIAQDLINRRYAVNINEVLQPEEEKDDLPF